MKNIKILGTGCAKCKSTYENVMKALQDLGMEAKVEKVEDLMKIMEYNVLTTPVLMIDEVMKVKGRVADVNEIKEFLKN